MRKGILLSILLVGLLVAFPVTQAVAQEHPEHPEHPEKSKKVDLDALESAIEAEIADMENDQGRVIVDDAVTGQTWELKLDKVHRERLSQIEPGVYFACVDFDSADGRKVDVDFFMKEDPSTHALSMHDLTIHKIDGVPRYNWREEDGFWTRVDID